MGGGGEGMEAPLSTGALEAMWREDGLRPVLQLADEPRMAGGPAAEAGRYRVTLSDGGARLQPGMLTASLNHLVALGALRRGTVIRVLEYFAGVIRNQRAIIVIQLEIVHAECTLICSPTIFEANATQHIGVSCSGGLAIHEPCFMPCTQQVISNSSCSPEKRVLDSSVTPRAEPTVINLPFSECLRSMPAQSTVDAKMQQLSLNGHQNQRFTVTATGLSGAMAEQLTPGAVVALSEHADGNGTLRTVLQKFLSWKELQTSTGLGRDPTTGAVVADDEWFESPDDGQEGTHEGTQDEEPSEPRQAHGTPPPFLDELFTLYGSRNRDRGTFMWAGGLGDPTLTPPRVSQEHIGLSSVGTSSKRSSRDQVVTSPQKKRSCSLGEYMHSISESIAAMSSRDRGPTREQQEQTEVMQMLREDSVAEGSELYYMALDLFQKRACRAQYKNIEERAHRVKYIEWTWRHSKQTGNK